MDHLNLYVARQAAHERETHLSRRHEQDRVVRERHPVSTAPASSGLREHAHDLLVRLHLLPAHATGTSTLP